MERQHAEEVISQGKVFACCSWHSNSEITRKCPVKERDYFVTDIVGCYDASQANSISKPNLMYIVRVFLSCPQLCKSWLHRSFNMMCGSVHMCVHVCVCLAAVGWAAGSKGARQSQDASWTVEENGCSSARTGERKGTENVCWLEEDKRLLLSLFASLSLFVYTSPCYFFLSACLSSTS